MTLGKFVSMTQRKTNATGIYLGNYAPKVSCIRGPCIWVVEDDNSGTTYDEYVWVMGHLLHRGEEGPTVESRDVCLHGMPKTQFERDGKMQEIVAGPNFLGVVAA